jgi:hypothetical protein
MTAMVRLLYGATAGATVVAFLAGVVNGEQGGALEAGAEPTSSQNAMLGRLTPTDLANGMPTARRMADAVIDLSTVSSPYSGSTTGNGDNVVGCGGGSDQGFSVVLQPGERITIGQTSNTFDSQHALRYGGDYPGGHVVACEDDPDEKVLSYTNLGGSDVPVYFTIDGYGGSEAGGFSLAWAIGDAPGTPVLPLSLMSN